MTAAQNNEQLHEQLLVSIVIPTYNHAHLIKKALNSLIEQTHHNWEALVVNNYSQDSTLEVIESYQDKRIKVINFRNNGSIAASRNVGIKNALGNYIAFLDSDDYWYPTKLEKCLHQLLNTQSDVCVNSEMIMRNETPIKPLQCGQDTELSYFKLLFNGNCISTSSLLLRKQCLEKVGVFNEDPEFITAEDYDLWLRIAQANFKFTSVDEILGGHLQHSSNSSSFVEKHHNAIKKVIETHFENFPDTLLIKINKKIRYSSLFYGTGRNATKQKKYIDSLRYFLLSFKANPFKLKVYPAAVISLYLIIMDSK